MTPEQLEEWNRLVKQNHDAWIACFEVLTDTLKVAKENLEDARKPLEAFNEKTKGLSSFLSTLGKASELEGHAGSRGHTGAVRRILHKKAVGIIRD